MSLPQPTANPLQGSPPPPTLPPNPPQPPTLNLQPTPQTPISPTPSNPSFFNNKNKLIIIVALLIVFLGLLITIIAISPKSEQKNPPISSPLPLPTANSVPKETEQTVTLFKNQPIKLTDSETTLELTENIIPGEGCFDCVNNTIIVIKTGLQEAKLAFPCGGVSGNCVIKQESFGYQLELINQVNTESVVIKIKSAAKM